MVKFISDSSCDLLHVDDVNFEAVPLILSAGDKVWLDNAALDTHEMLEYLASYKGRSYTACPSTDSWLKAFAGADEIYAAVMTSGLSGTYNSACAARNLYLSEHPEAKIYIVDSLTTGPELRLILEELMSLKASGLDFDTICSEIEKYKQHTRLFFGFKSLHNFAQNGRVNKVLASAIGVLGITILGTATREGTVGALGKCRGDGKVIRSLLDEMKNAGYCGGAVRILHVENVRLATRMAELIRSEFPAADILVYPGRGICSYYGETGGIIIGCETK